MDYQRYNQIKEAVVHSTRVAQGIGTLSEKTIHAVLKSYYGHGSEQEVPIAGKVVDIYTGDEIIEIQTRAFERMRGKLSVLLESFPVTIVYPIPRYKYVIWMEEDTGALSKPRKSPKNGTAYDIFPELYKIKQYLLNHQIKFTIVLMDMEEYRLLNGWSKDKKRGSVRYDRIPLDYIEEIIISERRDYMQFVPCTLDETFTVAEFANAARISKKLAGVVVNILLSLDIIIRIGKKGRAYLYEIQEIV